MKHVKLRIEGMTCDHCAKIDREGGLNRLIDPKSTRGPSSNGTGMYAKALGATAAPYRFLHSFVYFATG